MAQLSLRERIARIINDRPFTGGRENIAHYESDRKAALKLADKILAEPEIRDGLQIQGLA